MEDGGEEQKQAERIEVDEPSRQNMSNQTKTEQAGRWIIVSSIVSAASTTLIAIATVVYAYFSYGLWQQAEESQETTRKWIKLVENQSEVSNKLLELSKNQFNIQYRPYLSTSGRLARIDDNNKLMRLSITVQNLGGSTAHTVNYTFNVLCNDQPFPVSENLGMTDNVLFPRSTNNITLTLQGDEKAYKNILSSCMKLVLRVYIEYQGINEQAFYITEEQWLYDHDTGGFTPIRQTYK